MATRKRCRQNNICATTPAQDIGSTLTADLLLEVMARTDFVTLIRCTTVCKNLRRDILSPPFIRRVTQQAAPSILAYLSAYNNDWRLTLLHPITSAAVSFCDDHLSPFISCRGASLVDRYYPVTSRGGLVVLRRESKGSKGSSSMCVYDPMTGHLTFLSKPPEVCICNVQKYVLLTPADGIDCSFMLIFVIFYESGIKVYAATSSSRSWSCITFASRRDFTCWSTSNHNDPIVLRGGVIHWLAYTGDRIITYDVRTRTPGLVKLPDTNCMTIQLHLATSPDGKLLKLLAINKFVIYVWLQLPKVSTGRAGWVLESIIDIEEELRSLFTRIPAGDEPDVRVAFGGSSNKSGTVVLLQEHQRDVYIVLDLETKEMHTQMWRSSLLEIDLQSRLQIMKVFS